MPTYAEQRAEFSKNKQALSPIFKPETNIPATIVLVKSITSTIETSTQDNSQYANLKFIVDVQNADGTISTKEWNIGSESLAEILEDKGVDVGSSFVVTKSGEGFKTRYVITNVKNKEVSNGSVTQGATTQPTSPNATPSGSLGAK